MWAKVSSSIRSYSESLGKPWCLGVLWDASELGINSENKASRILWWVVCEGISLATSWMVVLFTETGNERGQEQVFFFFFKYCLFHSLIFFYWLEWKIKKYFDHRSLKYVDSQVRLSSGHLDILLLRYKIWEPWAKRLHWKPREWIIYHQRSLRVESWALRCLEVRIWGWTSEEEWEEAAREAGVKSAESGVL